MNVLSDTRKNNSSDYYSQSNYNNSYPSPNNSNNNSYQSPNNFPQTPTDSNPSINQSNNNSNPSPNNSSPSALPPSNVDALINQISENTKAINKDIKFKELPSINIPLIGKIYVKPMIEYLIGIVIVIVIWKKLGIFEMMRLKSVDSDNMFEMRDLSNNSFFSNLSNLSVRAKMLIFVFVFNIFFFLLNIYINTGEVGNLEIEASRIVHLKELIGVILSSVILFVGFSMMYLDKDSIKVFVIAILILILAYIDFAVQNKTSNVRTIRVLKQVLFNMALFLVYAGFVIQYLK
jgi:hypothetical protein